MFKTEHRNVHQNAGNCVKLVSKTPGTLGDVYMVIVKQIMVQNLIAHFIFGVGLFAGYLLVF